MGQNVCSSPPVIYNFKLFFIRSRIEEQVEKKKWIALPLSLWPSTCNQSCWSERWIQLVLLSWIHWLYPESTPQRLKQSSFQTIDFLWNCHLKWCICSGAGTWRKDDCVASMNLDRHCPAHKGQKGRKEIVKRVGRKIKENTLIIFQFYRTIPNILGKVIYEPIISQ